MELYRDNVVIRTHDYAFNDGHPTNLYLARYYDNNIALVVEDNDMGMVQHATLSINLPDDTPAPGCVFIKDYSEHKGLAENMERAGIIKILRPVSIAFGSGYEVKLLGDLPSVPEVPENQRY